MRCPRFHSFSPRRLIPPNLSSHCLFTKCIIHPFQDTWRLHCSVSDGFFSLEDSSFSSLGFAPEICEALAKAGFTRPSEVQSLAAKPILQGRNVILAAETGSGKTLAYLAPLASIALEDRRRQQAFAEEPARGRNRQEDIPSNSGNVSVSFLNTSDNELFGEGVETGKIRQHSFAPYDDNSVTIGDQDKKGSIGSGGTLVICPNIQLCEQANAVAEAVFSSAFHGRNLLTSAVISSRSPINMDPPDFAFSTPGAISSLIDGAGPFYGGIWTRGGLPFWAQRVVFDESDLLFGGSYAKDLKKILEVLRTVDRERLALKISLQLGISVDEYMALPRHLKRAARVGGVPAMLKAGYELDPTGGTVRYIEQIDAPWVRQYVLVAATMPRVGGKTVGADIAAHFPDAIWLSGRQLHQAQQRVHHEWHEVSTAEERTKKLAEVIQRDRETNGRKSLILVFCANVASTDATVAALRDVFSGSSTQMSKNDAFEPVIVGYHRGVPMEERRKVMERASKEKGIVLVCTDAAARGIDLPDVSHVVQADFASSAVDFLHRIGRTARAGKSGSVTSLYTPENAVLASALRDAVSKGEPIEGAFSRKRSFRKKLKKYGEYVPRGEKGKKA